MTEDKTSNLHTTAKLKDLLWHGMRADLAQYMPEIASTRLLMCCLCGRLLPQHDFTLEHIIPQQSLDDDPKDVKNNPAATRNARSQNILLCNKRLKIGGTQVSRNGCNSWKGSHFDRPLREIFNGSIFEHKHRGITDQHSVAAFCVAYIAMIKHFGYSVVLTDSGILCRKQFFQPSGFLSKMPSRYQLLLTGGMPTHPDTPIDFWLHPFGFEVNDGFCGVVVRNFVLHIPLSRDPRLPIAQHLKYAPRRFIFRPDFTTTFS